MQRPRVSRHLINSWLDGVRFIEKERMKEVFERKTYVICACMAVMAVAVGMSPPDDPGRYTIQYPYISSTAVLIKRFLACRVTYIAYKLA